MLAFRGHAASAGKISGDILKPIGGDVDNALLGRIERRNPGALCSLVGDGRARLMAYGAEALVDLGEGPVLLSLHPAAGQSPPQYVGEGVSVSGAFENEQVTDPYKPIVHKIPVAVRARGRSETFVADWTCQARLIAVRSR